MAEMTSFRQIRTSGFLTLTRWNSKAPTLTLRRPLQCEARKL